MLKNYTPAEYRTVTEYELVFDDGHNNGFGFPCDSTGKLLEGLNPAAYENRLRCMMHPEQFVRFNKVIRHDRRVKDFAHGTCSCGNEVELIDHYLGACQCGKCGKWYNLFGQELLPPDQWGGDSHDEDYY